MYNRHIPQKQTNILMDSMNTKPFPAGPFLVGVNYWASHAGMLMWRNWDADSVAKDVAALAASGVGLMRVFPLWEDFQPLTPFLGGGGADRGCLQNGGDLRNPAGVDEEMMARFRFLCDTASKHGIRLVVGLLTGWMSGRLFAPPALAGLNLLTDPRAVMWEVRFVRHFIREMKDHPAIAAWDLGNECNCLAPVKNRYEAWSWQHAISSAIRLEDAGRPVVSGMHSMDSDALGMWNLQDQGELLDVLTTHPYPLFTPECSHEPFNTLRNELHPSAESLFYAGVSGRPCFVEEAGSLGNCTASPARIAGALRAAMFSAWADGLGAYVWWCGFDQTHLDFPPYRVNAIERELGLLTKDRGEKPMARAMKDFRAFLDAFPYADLPPRRVDAVCLVSEMENAWPASFGAFLLSRQAGFDIAFAGAEHPLPKADLYILPSGSGWDPYTNRAWNAALAKAKGGATLLVSKGNDTRYSELLEATGDELDYFTRQARSFTVTLRDRPGMPLSAGDTTTTVIRAVRSEVLAEDADGAAMATVCPYGKGRVVFVNWALEIDAVRRSDAFAGDPVNPLYLVYRKAAELAGIRRRVRKELPGVGLTEHPLPDGRTLVVAVNYDAAPAVCPLEADGTVARTWGGRWDGASLSLDANDAAVLLLEKQGT